MFHPRRMKRHQILLFFLYCAVSVLLYLYQSDILIPEGECPEELPSRDYRIDAGELTREKGEKSKKRDGDRNSNIEGPKKQDARKRVKEETRAAPEKVQQQDKVKDERSVAKNGEALKKKEPCFRQIQIWTEEIHWTTKGKTDYTCPGLPCDIRQVEDTSFETMEKSDAVVFHYLSNWDWDEVHSHKRPGQKWIFTSAQSPVNTKRNKIPPKKYYDIYDYIMSYRRHEGGLFGDFGRTIKLQEKEKTNKSMNWAEGKNKLAVWAGTDCNGTYIKWNRMKFIRELAKRVPVDIYGRCGSEECEPFTPSCTEKIAKHKFYLALENCNCRNYITEVWDNAFANNLVPVVYGPPKEDYDLVLPEGSFIHIKNFTTLSKLAEFLLMLDKHDNLYNAYFDWKKKWKVESVRERHLLKPPRMCDVVKRLLADEKAKKEGKFTTIKAPDWEKWWFGSCDNSKPYPLLME